MAASQKLYAALLFHSLFLSMLPLKATSSARTQAEALIQWKNNLTSPPPSLRSWSPSNLNNLCNWTAISCNSTSRTVSQINLPSLEINGTLAHFNFTPFTDLTRFDIQNNTVSGAIPSTIGGLSKLIYLDLSFNFFEGSIPVEISELTELQYLSLFNNNLNGTIPFQLSNLLKVRHLDLGANYLETPDWSKFSMPSLEYLSLFLNELTSEFPDFITSCRNLTFLDLSLNNFTGQIPELAYTNLGKLETLNLYNNSFQGPLSPKISMLSNLKSLSLQTNLLGGQIPESIGSISGLRTAELFSNSFQGTIPSSLGKLKHLEKLDLRMNALNSTIPPELGLCTNLTYLALADNQLSGELPFSLSNLSKIADLGLSENFFSGEISPALISNWTELISFQVQNNNFSGNIPPEIGQLTTLQYLFLYNNSFSGSIPNEIGNLEELISLDLSGNQLSGPIPPTLWNLTNLETLNLFFNNINGTIPPEVGNMTSLQILDLNTNQLHGELPETISNLTSLTSINLFSNNFSGSIPSNFGKNIPSMVYASFSNNSFSGELPPELCSGLSLQQLTVNSNNFTGALPTCLRNCLGLTRVRLEDNQFTGNITHAFGVLPNLVFVALNDNQFIGEISPDWGECENLTNLQMGRNKISGEIPAELGKLPRLGLLSLDSNDLTGRIPGELGNLSMLFMLNLSNNHLKGEIPQGLGSLTRLESLDLSDNKLTGNISKELGGYEKLSSLDLSHNNLSGEIPFELGNLNLRYLLDLSSNSLSGTIPSNLGKLSMLENLNVSHNHLSGRIPDSLSTMISLHSFDFSYNELTGPIPTGSVFQNASARSFIGNSGLCGNVEGLSQCPTTDNGKSSKHNKKVLIGVIVPVCCLLVVATIFAVLLCCRKTKLLDEEIKRINNGESSESMVWEKDSKLTFGDIVNATDDFNEKYCIGRGGFGSVYKAVLSTGQVIAVKKLNMSDSSDIPALNRQSFENEIKLLTEVRHRNIIKLFGFCSRRGCLYLVYEYVERGSLGKVLYGIEGEAELGWGRRVNIVRGVAHAVAYLHHDCLSCCEECAQISIREVKNTDGACFLELKLPSRSRLRDGCWNFLERYGFRYGDDFTRPLLPCEVMQILKRIPAETRKKLSGKGYFPQDGYILQQLPVPPNCLSVPVVSDGITVMSSDLSISMLKKVLKQAEVIRSSRSGAPNFDAHKDEATSLQSMVDQYLQVRGTTKTSRDVDTRYGVKKESSESTTKAWLEKMRTLFIRKGSGFSSRSVITGDAYTLVNQVGIPYEIAQRITFEERVSVHNMRYLQELVDNKLCLTYKDGSSTYSLREGSKGHTFLRPGQVVHRRIMDGDIVFINRPPTTHKHSLQALSVYVHDDHAVKINPLICGPLSADFDGDCVHLFYPQSLAAKAEVLELFSVEKQLLSSHSGNLNLQLTTDSLLSLKMMFKACFLGKSAAQQLAMFISPYLPQPALLKVNCFFPHWTAHQILQMALPACFNCSGERFLIINSNFLKVDFNRDVVASVINEILISMFFEKGSGAVLKFFNSLQPMLMENLFSEGFSVSLEDFSISRAVKQRIPESFKAISPLLCNLRSTFNELVELQVENHIRDVKQPVREFILTSSALGYLIDSKSDAAVTKVVQQIGFLGLQVSDRGKLYSKTLVEDLASHFLSKYPANLFDYPSAQYGLIQNSFFHGLDAYEEMAHSISTREVIVRSSRGLSEPGTLFKNLMAILRDVVICYDGTVRNVSSNSIIQFEYGVKVGTESQSLFPAGEPVGVLAATAMSNPAYKAVLDSTPSSNSSWDMMKEILLCKVGFKNDLADRRVILYLNDCGCGRNYCQERAAYLVKNHLEKVSLKDIAKCFMIEYKSQQIPESFGSDAGLVGHVHLDKRKLQDLNITAQVILEKCQETVNSFRKKKKVGNLFKKTILLVSESCSFQQCIDESPCLMFFWQGADDVHLERTSNILADMICPVLLETIIKGDHRISCANIIWATPETNTWIRNPSRTQKGELALDIVLEKSVVKKSGDAWRIVLDSCLPVLHLINTTRSIPYAIKQVQELLGVSCAFDTAVQRLSKSVTMVAKGVLKEHLILLGNSMTCAGSLIGFYTGGYKTLSRSLDIQVPFTEATLFTPRKCFEKAAEKCHTDSLSSIVASCAWGKHVTVGTGSHFDVLWDTKEACLNPEGSMDVYSFLNMVRSTAGGEESVTACLGAEVDDLMLEDEDWNLSPEHNSSSDKPTFEDSTEFQDFLGNQPAESNWEKISSLKDRSRSSGNWDVDKNDGAVKEKPWSLGMNTAEANDVASSGWDTAAARTTNNSWNSENNVAQSNSFSGWATKKPEPHNGFATKVQEEPTTSNDWDTGAAWGRKDRDNKFAETNASKSWWGKVTEGDESGHNKSKNKRPEDQDVGTHGWDDKMSQDQSISGWASKTTQEATTESLGWDSKGNSNPGDAACGWKAASTWGAENTDGDKLWGKEVSSNQADTASGWGKPKSPEISLGWGSPKESVKSDRGWGVSSSGGGRDKKTENQSLAGQGKELGGWGNKVTSNQADTASGWGKPKSSENSQGWGLSKESGKEVHGWGVPNSAGGNGSETNNNNENQSLVEQGKESGWDNKASSNQEGTASGWGKPKSPALSEGWGSPREPVKAVHGWGLPNSGGGSGSGRDQQWGQQSREFKKDRFEGSRGWGSNNGDWKNKRNRPSKPQEDLNASGIFTTTRQRLDVFTSQEQDILSDIEPLMLSIRRIMHQTGYNDGDPLSADDQSYVLDNVFHYHPDKAVKMGAGIDHVTVSRHSNFQESRCFYIVSTDGCKQDFSYRKCLENFIKGKYPDLADEFIAKYFARRGNRQRTPAPEGTEEEKQAL